MEEFGYLANDRNRVRKQWKALLVLYQGNPQSIKTLTDLPADTFWFSIMTYRDKKGNYLLYDSAYVAVISMCTLHANAQVLTRHFILRTKTLFHANKILKNFVNIPTNLTLLLTGRTKV